MPARRHRDDQGFTIIELMIVLVIIAMAMTVAPAIMAGLDGSRLRAASDELVARLRETRNQALLRDGATELVLDLGKRSYTITTQSGLHALPPIVDAIDIAPAALRLPGGIVRIRFLADGTATAARITLRHGASAGAVTVDWLTGKVHLDG